MKYITIMSHVLGPMRFHAFLNIYTVRNKMMNIMNIVLNFSLFFATFEKPTRQIVALDQVIGDNM